jgi:hypothetical protein
MVSPSFTSSAASSAVSTRTFFMPDFPLYM